MGGLECNALRPILSKVCVSPDGSPDIELKSIEIRGQQKPVFWLQSGSPGYVAQMMRSAKTTSMIGPGEAGSAYSARFRFADNTCCRCTISPFATGNGFVVWLFVSEWDADATIFEIPFAESIPDPVRKVFHALAELDDDVESEKGKEFDLQ